MGCFSRAWFALMRRNMVYLRRNWFSTALEITLPLAFISILVAIKSSSNDLTADVVEATLSDVAMTPLTFTDYVTAMRAQRVCLLAETDDVGNDASFNISGIMDQGFNWQVPLVKCDSRLCTEHNQDATTFCEYGMIAVAGNNEGGRIRADAFKSWVETTYPAIVADGVMPFDFDLVQIFDSPDAMNRYVRATDYGVAGMPKIAMGIVWDGDSETNYTYQLRPNSTNFNAPESESRRGTQTTPSTGVSVDNFARDDESVCEPLAGSPSQGPLENSCTGQYLYNGVLTFQRLVHDFIFEESGAAEAGTTVAEAGVQFASFPIRSFRSSSFYDTIEGIGSLILILGLLYPVASMISYVVKEKELRQKELMKMMSVSESDINWSWFATFMLVHVVTATLAAVLSMALYERSSFFLLWLFWMLTIIALVGFSMTVSALSSKTVRSILIGLLIYFAGYVLSSVFIYSERSQSLLQILSVHPVTAFAYGLDQIGSLEGGGVGLTRDSMSFSENESGYAFRDALTMLIVDCILWGVLSWYLNRVIQPDFGQALPWYFPVTSTYWLPSSPNQVGSSVPGELRATTSNIPNEAVSDALKRQTELGQSVEICDLCKVFGEKIAVDGLNLSIYSGQITALLGHNGAGKTTTISMLTGAMAPTKGSVYVAGKDIRTHQKAIRQNIGICLQHDCLFPNLTVREHVQFFSRLKGVYDKVSIEEAEEQIDQSIRDVALFEKRNTYSKDLSGGMKRKLSVALAFVESKFVVLDEPTSGMDPFSRRFIWNVIRAYKKDRIIILTTHFMDEADILGDRIAIMAEGQLRCADSSLFLKKHYGIGYQLTVEKSRKGKAMARADSFSEVHDGDSIALDHGDDDEVSSSLSQLIKESVPSATLLNDVGTEARYQLPLGASDQFARMFAGLDAQVDKSNIVSYGVSMTTLDEVFLLVARGDATDENKAHLASSRGLDVTGGQDDVTDKSVRSRMDLETEALFGRHVTALLRKRAFNFRRDNRAWCCTTILPVLFVTIGFLAVRLASPERNLSPITLELSVFNPGISDSPINPIPVNSPSNPFVCQPGVCSYTPLVSVEETQETYTFCGSHINVGGGPGENGFSSINVCSLFDSTAILRTLDGFQGAVTVEANVESVLESSQSLFGTALQYASSQYGAIWFTREPGSLLVGNARTNTTFSVAVDAACRQSLAEGVLDYTTEGDCVRFRDGYGYVVQYNHTGLHSAPLYHTLADQALLRNTLNNPDVIITTTIAPLPLTEIEEGLGDAQDTFTAWFLVMMSFPFIAGAYASFIVVERESKAKHLQTVAGVEPSAYWISSLLWDTINYQIPLWLMVAELFLFDIRSLTTTDRDVSSGILVLLFVYGPASAGFAYCWSFVFKSPSLCNIFLIVVGFLVGFGGPLTIYILTIIGEDRANPQQSLVDIATALTWVLRFFPSFCLGKGLFFAINIESISFFEEDFNLSVWSEPILLVEVIVLVVQGAGYTFLAMMLDVWSNNPHVMKRWNDAVGMFSCKWRNNGSHKVDITTALREDEDVIAEEERVLSGGANDDLIVVDQLSKIYGNGNVAVNRLSLGIPHGECFGLLGINGAGKTTTMGMLTAEFPPTSGDATLAGFSISREPQRTRRRIGYCPQFDAHFAQLSGRNHVELYASIKGVPPEFVKEAAALKLREVGLNDFDSDRLCSNYSGGMRRRLSLACATIGQPQIVFLDECSTGVDPVARREIWQLVSDMVSAPGVPANEQASVILTTHSMEECEALCPRIGIMANGRLRCLGSAQHLKNKFGQGFQVEMKTMIADRHDDAYVRNTNVLAASLVANSSFDPEAVKAASPDVSFNHEHAVAALQVLTKDDFLSAKVAVDDPVGYGVWKDSTSPNGVSLDVLAAFATVELRMRSIADFMTAEFPQHVLRERQDTKARYEVSASGTRISSIFQVIEANKGDLRLADYGVSQTSLEQVFNLHAAEAEKLKQGRDDH